jgi:hypothetical protein
MMTHADLAKAQEAAILSIEYMDKVGYTPETKHDYYRDAMEGQILLAKIYIKQGTTQTKNLLPSDPCTRAVQSV